MSKCIGSAVHEQGVETLGSCSHVGSAQVTALEQEGMERPLW